ncbi:MAG: type II secretion system F family protein [Nocardioides sp.]
MSAVVAGLLAGLAAGFLTGPRWSAAPVTKTEVVSEDWMPRHRWALSGLAAAGGWLLIGGPIGIGAGLVAAAVTWRVISNAEPAQVRRRREQVWADMPQAVRLLAGALEAGAPVEGALKAVGTAVGGPVGQMFTEKAAALGLGVDPSVLWAQWTITPETAALGRSLGHAHTSGVPIAAVVRRLASEAARDRQVAVETRARSVGVRAAIPLGVCFLPAFVLVGIVPQVGSLIHDVVTPTPATPVAQP